MQLRRVFRHWQPSPRTILYHNFDKEVIMFPNSHAKTNPSQSLFDIHYNVHFEVYYYFRLIVYHLTPFQVALTLATFK